MGGVCMSIMCVCPCVCVCKQAPMLALEGYSYSVCLYVCLCICISRSLVGLMIAFKPLLLTLCHGYHNYHCIDSSLECSSPTHPAANGDLEFSWGANCIFHIPSLVQVGLRVPTPLSGRDGQSSCELLALLQEFASIGSECLLNAQAAWLHQVIMTCSEAAIYIFLLGRDTISS